VVFVTGTSYPDNSGDFQSALAMAFGDSEGDVWEKLSFSSSPVVSGAIFAASPSPRCSVIVEGDYTQVMSLLSSQTAAIEGFVERGGGLMINVIPDLSPHGCATMLFGQQMCVDAAPYVTAYCDDNFQRDPIMHQLTCNENVGWDGIWMGRFVGDGVVPFTSQGGNAILKKQFPMFGMVMYSGQASPIDHVNRNRAIKLRANMYKHVLGCSCGSP
jgi:hypothetical protein